MRTRGITIYQETLIPRKKIQWYCTRGSNSDTAKRLGGLACWWPHWNPSMSWKFRLYVLETPWFYVYPSRGIQIHWKTKAQIAVNWYHWPTFILPIQTHQIAAVQRQPTYFFSGWCFGTCFMTFHSVGNVWNVIIPTDELHHFSRWLLHHQPDYY